jgi:hypothetical protein
VPGNTRLEIHELTANSGVDATARIASPTTDAENSLAIVDVAVKGVQRLLEAASKEPSVKSFVPMFFIAAIRASKDPDHDTTYTEADWNTSAEGIVAAKGDGAPWFTLYEASTTYLRNRSGRSVMNKSLDSGSLPSIPGL